ncbi:hypothetical protein IAU59_001352 [Kwoniella sp. CBS 9459]
MFISTIASSSRLPHSIPAAAATPCHLCRLFTTSTARSVKRPQKPYEAPVAKVDAYGNRIPLPSEMDKGSIRTREFFETLAERRAKTPTEKYGSSHGFGIKQRQRPTPRSEDEEHVGHSETMGQKEEYEARRDELWREKIGLQLQQYGKAKYMSAEQRFKEEAARLNWAGSRNANGNGKSGLGSRGARSAFGGRGADFGTAHQGERARSGTVPSTGDVAVGQNTPRKTFGINREARPQHAEEPTFTPRSRFDQSTSSSGIRFKEQSPKSLGPFGQGQFVGQHKTPSTIIYSDEKRVKKAYGLSDRRQVDRDGDERSRGSRGRDAGRDHNHARSSSSIKLSSTAPGTASTPYDTSPDFVAASTTASSETDPALESINTNKPASRPWQPTKKLTYSAMAGLKALHQVDPDKFTKGVLSKKFGISYEAVSRILRSKYREADHKVADADGENKLKGTKWDRDPSTSETVSPVPAILRAYERINNRE